MFTIGNYVFLGFLIITLLVGKIIIIMRLTIFFLSWLRNWNAVWKLKGVDVND